MEDIKPFLADDNYARILIDKSAYASGIAEVLVEFTVGLNTGGLPYKIVKKPNYYLLINMAMSFVLGSILTLIYCYANL